MSELAINTERKSTTCPQCKTRVVDMHFCSTCGRIQPVASGIDFFSFMGLPRKLQLDEAQLESTFYSLSRQFHPDYFMRASQDEQQASMERSSVLNDAYRTLRDRIARAAYLLHLEGYKEAEKRAPADLLEEVFELNMRIEELKIGKKTADQDAIADARSSLEDALTDLRFRLAATDQRISALFEEWDSALDNAEEADNRKRVLDQMSELLSHRSYIRNLVCDITEGL